MHKHLSSLASHHATVRRSNVAPPRCSIKCSGARCCPRATNTFRGPWCSEPSSAARRSVRPIACKLHDLEVLSSSASRFHAPELPHPRRHVVGSSRGRSSVDIGRVPPACDHRGPPFLLVRSGRDQPIAGMARLSRKSGPLVHRHRHPEPLNSPASGNRRSLRCHAVIRPRL